MVNMLLFGIVDMIILKEFKKLFILTNLSKNLSFIFIINTLMLFDIIGFIQKNLNPLINLSILLSLMLQNLEKN